MNPITNMLQIYSSLAQSAYDNGDLKLTETLLLSFIREQRRQNESTVRLETAQENLALVYTRQGRYTKAVALYCRLLKVSEENADGITIRRLSYSLADVYHRMRYFHRVEQFLRKGLVHDNDVSSFRRRNRMLLLALEAQGKRSRSVFSPELISEAGLAPRQDN